MSDTFFASRLFRKPPFSQAYAKTENALGLDYLENTRSHRSGACARERDIHHEDGGCGEHDTAALRTNTRTSVSTLLRKIRA